MTKQLIQSRFYIECKLIIILQLKYPVSIFLKKSTTIIPVEPFLALKWLIINGIHFYSLHAISVVSHSF